MVLEFARILSPIRRRNLTTGIQKPTVETNNATDIEATAATINGTIADDGGDTIDERRFDWGTTTSCEDDWTNDVNVSGDSFSYRLTELEPDTTYYFRAWAHNSEGWSYGDVLSFTTNPQETEPNLISPSNNSSQSGEITFQWENVSGATNYRLYLKIPGNSLGPPMKQLLQAILIPRQLRENTIGRSKPT